MSASPKQTTARGVNDSSYAFFDRLVSVLRKTVEQEVRGVALTLGREDVRPTGPHDLDAEQSILSAVLCEHVTIEALRPLEPRHFYSNFNQHLFSALSLSSERDLQLVADSLDMFGPVVDELATIKDATPFALETTLRKQVNTTLDRWRERQLIDLIQVIDAEIRVGVLTVDGARLRLREFFMGATK